MILASHSSFISGEAEIHRNISDARAKLQDIEVITVSKLLNICQRLSKHALNTTQNSKQA